MLLIEASNSQFIQELPLPLALNHLSMDSGLLFAFEMDTGRH